MASDIEVAYGRSRGRLRRRSAQTLAVKNASICAPRGEITGIVGESGSGKSSLGLAMAGLNGYQTGGTTLIYDDPQTSRRPARADIQMVFQDPVATLDPRQSIQGGLAELSALYPGRSDWIGPEGLLGKVGLEAGLLRRYPHQLSGGQCQRISIARALLLRPFAIIADEPTSSLDVSVQAQVLDLLRHLCATEQLALVLITHDFAVVRQTCEQVYVMKSGAVVESGDCVDVLTRPQHSYTKELLSNVPGSRLEELTRAAGVQNSSS